jgi:hypothetical protein
MKALNILLIGLLFLFVLLKSTGVVDWHWLIILSPFWLPAGIVWLVVSIGLFIDYKQKIEER